MNKITNPVTGRKVSVYGKTGRQIVNNYLNEQQEGGDVSAHMGSRASRRTHRLTREIQESSGRILGDDSSVEVAAAASHEHDQMGLAARPNVSSIALEIIKPVAHNLRERARGTRAERDEGIKKNDLMGPVYPVVLDSAKLAEVLQSNTINKTKDQITFLSGEGSPSNGEQNAYEEALRFGDGSGLMDYPNLKLLFRGVLYDFMMRDGKIVFQIEKSPNVHSRCQTRGSRRLDGVIRFTKSKQGKIVLNKVELERQNCWPKKLASSHPVAKVSL